MKLRAGVINGPKNPQFSFSTAITGEIRDRDAELLVDYKNEKGETGVLLGVNARPLFEGHGKGNGIAFYPLIPKTRLSPSRNSISTRSITDLFHKNSVYNVDSGMMKGWVSVFIPFREIPCLYRISMLKSGEFPFSGA